MSTTASHKIVLSKGKILSLLLEIFRDRVARTQAHLGLKWMISKAPQVPAELSHNEALAYQN